MLEPVSANVSQCLWALLPTCYKTLWACKIKVPWATGCSQIQFHWWLRPETLHVRPFTPTSPTPHPFFLSPRLLATHKHIERTSVSTFKGNISSLVKGNAALWNALARQFKHNDITTWYTFFLLNEQCILLFSGSHYRALTSLELAM